MQHGVGMDFMLYSVSLMFIKLEASKILVVSTYYFSARNISFIEANSRYITYFMFVDIYMINLGRYIRA